MKAGRVVGLWIAVLSVVLVAPWQAEAATPVASLASNSGVMVSGVAAKPGTAIYSGDNLVTAGQPATLVLQRNNVAVIESHSSASVARASSAVRLSLERGQLLLNASSPQLLSISASGLSIKSTTNAPLMAEVALNADGSIMMGVAKGQVAVAGLGRSVVSVSSGQYIRISPTVAQNDTAGTNAHGKKNGKEKTKKFHVGKLSHGATTGTILSTTALAAVLGVTIASAASSSTVSSSTP